MPATPIEHHFDEAQSYCIGERGEANDMGLGSRATNWADGSTAPAFLIRQP